MLKNIRLAQHMLNKMLEVLSIDKTRCVRLRHKASKCDKCMFNCPTSAITVGNVGGGIDIKWEKCVECGICCNTCDTGVFRLKHFSDMELIDRFKSSIRDNKIEVCCNEVEDNTNVHSARVSCLGMVNTVHILGMVSCGASQLHFRHSRCSDCKAKLGSKIMGNCLKVTKDLLESFSSTQNVKVTMGMQPAGYPKVVAQKQEDVLSRRQLFNFLSTQAKCSIVKTIATFEGEENKDLGVVTELPKKIPLKRQILLSLLKGFGQPQRGYLDTLSNPFWAKLEIDSPRCDQCGMCIKFCPTGALEKNNYSSSDKDEGVEVIFFTPAHCVKCGLCVDACYQGAIKFGSRLHLRALINQSKYVAFPQEITNCLADTKQL